METRNTIMRMQCSSSSQHEEVAPGSTLHDSLMTPLLDEMIRLWNWFLMWNGDIFKIISTTRFLNFYATRGRPEETRKVFSQYLRELLYFILIFLFQNNISWLQLIVERSIKWYNFFLRVSSFLSGNTAVLQKKVP
jgi:hypothetical protein